MRWFTRLPRWQMAVFAALIVGTVALFVVHPVSAQSLLPFERGIAQVIGAIIAMFGWLITKILLMAVNILIKVAAYNDFVTSPAVLRGWVIVRDLTNMFFIVVMLVIAFGTVLGLEEYSYKRMLPRLLIMAVVINFSKLICGLIIDFSQVVMITFVDGFSAIAAGNFLNLFSVVSFSTANADAVTNAVQQRADVWMNVGSLLLGAIMMLIALTCVAILTLMLVFRIVMLWLLVVLSPLAFFLSAFPKGKAASAYAKWWELFGNYVIVGPFVAFFLWLSLAVAGTGNLAATQGLVDSGSTNTNSISLFTSEGGTTPVLISFIIGTAMLLGGMQLASQFGTIGGSAMAGAAQWFQKAGKAVATSPFTGARWAGAKAGGVAKGVVGSYAQLADAKIAKATGVHLDPRFYTRGLQAGMKTRITEAQADALKTNQARAQRGDAMSGFYQLAGDPEGAARAGVVNTAWKGAKAFKNTPMGYEAYAGFADQRRQRVAEVTDMKGDARKSQMGDLDQVATSASAMADNSMYSENDRNQAKDRAKQANDMKQRLAEDKQLTEEDRGWLQEQQAAAPEGSDTRQRLGQVIGQESRVDKMDADIAVNRGEEQKYIELAARSQAAFGKPLTEPAKHGMDGRELASRYRVAQDQGDTETMVRYYKWAGVNGEMDEFSKELGIEIKGTDLDKLKAISAKVSVDTKTGARTMGEVNDEISSSNKGKDKRLSNTVVTGAGGMKRFATEAEKQTADANDSTKGDNYKKEMDRGIMKQSTTEDAQGNPNFTPAGLYGFIANLDKVITRAQKGQMNTEDVSKMLNKFEHIQKQVVNVTPTMDQKGVIDKLSELKHVLEGHSKAGSFKDLLRALRDQQHPSRPVTVNVKGGGGGGGGSSGGSSGGGAPGSPPPARPSRPTTSAPPATPARPTATAPTGGSFGGSVPPPTPPTTP